MLTVQQRFLALALGCLITVSVVANPLYPNTTLNRGQSIQSPLKKYNLIMQTDGSLVMYRADGTKRYAMAKYGQYAIMQGDGNFVEYGTGGVALFNTGTWGNPNALLYIQDDGNLVVYSSTWIPLWNIGADTSTNDPTRVGDVIGRDLDVAVVGFAGHVGIWDGSKVIEATDKGNDAVRQVTLNDFKSLTTYWGSSTYNIPNEYVSVDCGQTFCDYTYSKNTFDVDARQAITRRAFQIYLIGSDYTWAASPKLASPATQWWPAKRGVYRCDTFVLDAMRSSTNDRYALPYSGYIYPTTSAMQTWRNRYIGLTYAPTPRYIFDTLKTFK